MFVRCFRSLRDGHAEYWDNPGPRSVVFRELMMRKED